MNGVKKMDFEPVIEEDHGYQSDLLFYIDRTLELCRRPGRVAFDRTVCCFFPTRQEKSDKLWWLKNYFIKFPVFLLVMIPFLPFQFFCYIMGGLFEKYFRKSYIMSFSRRKTNGHVSSFNYQPKKMYSFCTSNLCLLPEYVSRFNNLPYLDERMEEMAKVFNNSQQAYCDYSNRNIAQEERYWQKRKDECPQIVSHSNDRCKIHDACPSFDVSISTELPPVDFLLLQEACWMKEISEKLKNKLHKHYPYIVYEAGCQGLHYNMFFTGSGVMIASKYPILNAEFKPFEDSIRKDLVTCKGLLMAKVHLGKNKNGKDIVGYLSTTHLQVHQGTNTSIHKSQLDAMVSWTIEYRRTQTQASDVVAFDVLSGDFNLDNMSPLDSQVWGHPIFMERYKDLGRKKPGQDYDWAVGTEMRHPTILDSEISTPQGLKDVLQDDLLRQYYFLTPDLKESEMMMAKKMTNIDIDGNIIQEENGGKRRIDFLLFSPQDNPTPICFNPVTALANLTDHLPYCLALQVDPQAL